MNEEIRKVHNILLDAPDDDTLDMSLADCHAPGLFSLVLNGVPGTLTRVFISENEIKMGDIALHSHRYGLDITTLTSGFRHHEHSKQRLNLCAEKYRYTASKGELVCISSDYFDIKSYDVPIGTTITLAPEDIHTVSCSPGTMWIVRETGFRKESSVVVGVPFKKDGLYNKPSLMELTQAFTKVDTQVSRLISTYNLVKK